MAFIEKYSKNLPTLSYELFPPKNPAGWGTLYSTLGEICKQAPDYISVTYGAGGSTRHKTVDLVGRIQNELGIESMAHLTCVGHSRLELGEILDSLQQSGIKSVLALRGDPPKGDKTFQAHPQGFAHATNLIDFISRNFKLNIGCACYPEKHLESASLDEDIVYLKSKQDFGAGFAITQLFFENENLYRFRDKAAKAGIHIPIIAGIMPVIDINQLSKFQEMCGCDIPQKLRLFLGDGMPTDVVQKGVDYAVSQCEDLLKNGIAGIHLYSLNRSASSVNITESLKAKGYFQADATLAK